MNTSPDRLGDDGGEREPEYPRLNEYRGLMEETDREVLEFIGDEGKTSEQVSDRFPAFDLERLVRAELARPRRINPVKSQSRHAPPARARSTSSRLAEPRQSASLHTRFTPTDDRLANEPCDVALSQRSRGLDDGREGELRYEDGRRRPRLSAVERRLPA